MTALLPLHSTQIKYVLLREGVNARTGTSVFYGEVYYDDGSVLGLDLQSSIETAAREANEVARNGGCQAQLCLLPGRRA